MVVRLGPVDQTSRAQNSRAEAFWIPVMLVGMLIAGLHLLTIVGRFLAVRLISTQDPPGPVSQADIYRRAAELSLGNVLCIALVTVAAVVAIVAERRGRRVLPWAGVAAIGAVGLATALGWDDASRWV